MKNKNISEKGEVKQEELLNFLVNYLREKHEFTSKDIARLLKEKERFETKEKEILIPTAIFDNKKLSALETIVKYLKEELNLNYRSIALLLNRNERTIWGSYNSAKQKFPSKFVLKKSKFFIPYLILQDRTFGVLEIIVEYLKDTLSLSYHKIALLLRRDDRTIWTVYHRAKKKREASSKSQLLKTRNI